MGKSRPSRSENERTAWLEAHLGSVEADMAGHLSCGHQGDGRMAVPLLEGGGRWLQNQIKADTDSSVAIFG